MRSFSSIVVLFALSAGPAAAVVVPGDGRLVALPGASLATQPQLAGKVVEEEWLPFSYLMEVNGSGASFIDYSISGRVHSQVVKAVDGSFDFYWRILPNRRSAYSGTDADGERVSGVYGGGLPISTFSVSSFGGAPYRADWRSDLAAGPAPVAAAARDGTIGFSFGDTFFVPEVIGTQMPDGTTFYTDHDSAVLFLDTDAHAYARTGSFSISSLQDSWYGGFGAKVATFAPSPVPEPATTALMGAGLLGVALAVRRRRRA